MNTLLLLPLTLILLLLICWRLNYKQQQVIVADAGPTLELTAQEQEEKSFSVNYRVSKMPNGDIVDTRDYIRVYVDGGCMENRGIPNKSQVLVYPLNNDVDFKKQVKIGDVLLIRLHDKGVHKLRILKNYDDPNQLITYRYENGHEHQSKRNHNPNDVMGVVKYIVN